MTRKQKNRSIRIALTALLTVVLLLLPINGTPRFLLFLIPYLLIGYDVLAAAFRGLIAKQITDESLLMAIATVGALVLGAIGEGDYTEAIAVLGFIRSVSFFNPLPSEKAEKALHR